MKTIITTVGTSIFTNYLKKKKDINDKIEDLKLQPSPNWKDNIHDINSIRKSVIEWAKDNENASAEIKSLLKLKEIIDENIEVQLLATDTILSVLSAEILSNLEILNNITINFNRNQDTIKGLQVRNSKQFRNEGLCNLVNRIHNIANGNYKNIIFNITGGYKAVIPYLTIMAQVNNCLITYIFEDTKELITIPETPIKIDYDIFEENYNEIKKLEDGIEDFNAWKSSNYNVVNMLEEKGLIEKADNIAVLSPLGIIFFNRFQNQFFVFYAPDEIYNEIKNQSEIKRILKEKFSNEEMRKNKTEQKKSHYVYDDGNNPNRIYYFEDKALIYIYKTFEDEEKAKKYIDNTIDKNNIIKDSKKRKIQLCQT